MACGVVPICLRMRSGVPELIEDGVTGLLVRDREGDFVAAVRRLREEPGLWERLSRAARAKIEAEYSNEACAALWESFLRELHSTTRPNRSLRIPYRVTLPSIHPALAREDHRRPPLYRVFLRDSTSSLAYQASVSREGEMLEHFWLPLALQETLMASWYAAPFHEPCRTPHDTFPGRYWTSVVGTCRTNHWYSHHRAARHDT